jgi:hypothetical protein
VRRYSVDGAAGMITAQQHQFAVVEFDLPGGKQRYLVDPSYAQFVSEGPRMVLEADRIRGTHGGAEFVGSLVENGFVPLTDTTARTYLESLVPERNFSGQRNPPIDHTRLLKGEGGILVSETDPFTGKPDVEAGMREHVVTGKGAPPLEEQFGDLRRQEVVPSEVERAADRLRAKGRPDLAHTLDELRFRMEQARLRDPDAEFAAEVRDRNAPLGRGGSAAPPSGPAPSPEATRARLDALDDVIKGRLGDDPGLRPAADDLARADRLVLAGETAEADAIIERVQREVDARDEGLAGTGQPQTRPGPTGERDR